MKKGRIATVIIIAAFAILMLGSLTEAKELKKIVMIHGVTFFTANMTPYLGVPKYMGYWEEEGLDVEIQTIDGASPAIQQVLAGKAQFSTHTTPMVMRAREEGGKIRCSYLLIPHNYNYPAVLENSPIKSLQELKGKTIGIQTVGGGPYVLFRAMIEHAGLDPDKDVKYLTTGLGGPAGEAIRTGKVDALALWDAQYAALENKMNLKFRALPSPLSLDFPHCQFCLDSYAKENPNIVIGLNRGIAKATLFSMTNPEAAVRIFWKMYPEGKAVGVDEATALKQDLKVLNMRLEAMRTDNTKSKKWGGITCEEVEGYAKVLQKAGQLKKALPCDEYYNGSFIDEINNFDKEKVIQQAKSFKMK